MAIAVAAAMAVAILAVGGPRRPEVVALALIGAVAFGDLTRRGLAERAEGRSDPTDVTMSAAFALILIGGAFDLRDGGHATSPPVVAFAFRSVGAALILAGVWLRRRAARALGENFLVRLGVREGHTLVMTGPFRWVRHPNYTALLAVALGTAAALGSPVALALTFLVWLPIVFVRMSREEQVLVAVFGDRYREYRDRTWKLFPGVV